jgi:hypothetical protein
MVDFIGMIYRQGDVLFKKVDVLPKKKRKLDTDIIVRGEATGHAHRITNGILYSSWQRGTRLYIKASKGAKVVHEEHKELELDQGIYEVIRQREYDPNAPTDPWVED